jgi:cell division septal protein FtsQ
MRGHTGVLSPRGVSHGGLADLAEPSVAMAGQRLDRRRRRRRALRRIRRLGTWLAAGVALAALSGPLASGGAALLKTSRVAIERVEVAGQSRLSADEVVAASGLVPGQNLWSLDARRAVAGVEALPLVRRAEVVRAFPNRVTLFVEERQPFTLVNAGGLHWVDEQGVPLGPETRAVSLDAPVISGAGAEDVVAAGRLPSERVASGVALLRALMRAQSALLSEISEVDVSRPEGPVLYMLDGVEVHIGNEDWEGRLGRLGGVLAQLRASGQTVTSIDLRFRDQVVMKTAKR